MTVGELDYTTMLVDNLELRDPVTHAHLVPYRESSFIFMCLFIFAMPIVLMNLLVGKWIKSKNISHYIAVSKYLRLAYLFWTLNQWTSK